MSTDQTIQLPPDITTANKNLLRGFAVNVASGTAGTANATFQQVAVLADADGNLVSAWSGLSVADPESRALLGDIRDRLDILIGLFGK